MKLVKLSLAAVVAAGSFSFANAVALDEAIQNVDLSGYLRYRYDTLRDKSVETTKAGSVTTYDNDGNAKQAHRYKAVLNFQADIADNFKAHTTFEYSNTQEDGYGETANANVNNTFKVTNAYLSYTNFDTTFNIGRQTIGSIWTDDLFANGIKVVNNSIEGLTLAAYVFDNYNADGDLYAANEVRYYDKDGKKQEDSLLGMIQKNPKAKVDLLGRNLYGVAAIGSFAPVDFQVWVAYMNKIGTFYAVDFAANLGDKDDFAYRIHAQYAGNSLKKGEFKELIGVDESPVANGNFYGIEAGFDAFGADFNLGYVAYGKKDKFTVNTIEDEGQLINVGEIVMSDYQLGYGKKDFVFLTLGYTYADVRFGVDLVYGKNKFAVSDKVNGKDKLFEVTPRLSYKYSDKLEFSSFYAYGKRKTTVEGKEGNTKDTEKQIRLEAKYTF
ncbi:major outer membrane protein [Campylobacter sp. MG1]|uniref:major outer membrane protein n=1 Tax=Campylobacter sp. MG1 TaxID=2976332 RepID=UPI00226CCEDF|nr:major outer membrane protein [Campylobacter sp. MG1]